MDEKDFDLLQDVAVDIVQIRKLMDILMQRTDREMNWDDKSQEMHTRITMFIDSYELTQALLQQVFDNIMSLDKKTNGWLQDATDRLDILQVA